MIKFPLTEGFRDFSTPSRPLIRQGSLPSLLSLSTELVVWRKSITEKNFYVGESAIRFTGQILVRAKRTVKTWGNYKDQHAQ